MTPGRRQRRAEIRRAMQKDLGRHVTPAEVSQAEAFVTGVVVIGSIAELFRRLFEEAQRGVDDDDAADEAFLGELGIGGQEEGQEGE